MIANKKVLYTKSAPSPYKVDFFNEFGKKCNLDVLYEYDTAYGRAANWSKSKAVHFNEIYMKSFKFYKNLALCYGFRKIIKRNYDFIIVGEYSTIAGMLIIIYLNIKRIPFILSIDGGYIKNESTFMKTLKKYFISSASYWLSPSGISDDYLCYYGANIDNIRRYGFTSIYKSQIISKSIPDKRQRRQEIGITTDFVIITVGQFIHRKGFDILLKSIKSIDNTCTTLIVGGKSNSLYNKIIEDENLKNVRFIDFCDKNSLRKLYELSDVFVLPTREDIWGLVVNEAMAAGLPIITTRTCIAGLELIEDGINGFLVESESFIQLSETISRLLYDCNLEEFGFESAKKIGKYTFEEMVISHISLLSEIDQLY